MSNTGKSSRPSFVVVGCGKVGTSLALYLKRSGYPAKAAVSRSLSSAKRAAEICGAEEFGTRPWEYTREAGIVVITTPDAEIEPTCESIAENKGFGPESVVLHCSGALPSTILQSAQRIGAAVGSLHPLQSFASTATDKNPFEGIVFALEGDEAARKTTDRIAVDLGGRALALRTEGKALYHAAAVSASNYLVALVDMAAELLSSAGIASQKAPDVLGPLIRGTLNNIEKLGTAAALTGPIARGDRETVRRHLEEIRIQVPELAGLYSALGKHTVSVALRGGHLDSETARRLSALFE